MKLSTRLASLTLLVALSTGATLSCSRAPTAATVRAALESHLARDGITSVALTPTTDGHYTGIATTNDGRTFELTVNVTGDLLAYEAHAKEAREQQTTSPDGSLAVESSSQSSMLAGTFALD